MTPPCAVAAAQARQEEAFRTAHRLALEVEAIRAEGFTTNLRVARALTERGVPTPGGAVWTHTTVARVIGRLGAGLPLMHCPPGADRRSYVLACPRPESPHLND
ncbi:recombinase-like helix-turn-helix domain-containing protein [Roseomonas sp. KE2513]|uniref:recombinase-like helix-turn-helix domain-containing protein n=1 Tax=Roseomonas sp. KE2513 TaxID=2479202 RepID=UPI0035CBDF78